VYLWALFINGKRIGNVVRAKDRDAAWEVAQPLIQEWERQRCPCEAGDAVHAVVEYVGREVGGSDT